MKADRGFTLIEVLVAAAVLSITASALFGLFSRSLFNIGRVEDLHRYELAAENLMNELLLFTTLPAGGEAGGILDDSGARWNVTVQPWAPADLESKPPEGILRVVVSVTWPGRSITRRIQIEALKPAQITYLSNYDFRAVIEDSLPK
jgi:general secretion pathway protein I